MSDYSGIILAGGDGARLAWAARRPPVVASARRPWEDDAARAVYGRLPSTDLSRHVFQTCAESLAVLPVSGVSWTDLGDPRRVHEARARLDWQSAIA